MRRTSRRYSFMQTPRPMRRPYAAGIVALLTLMVISTITLAQSTGDGGTKERSILDAVLFNDMLAPETAATGIAGDTSDASDTDKANAGETSPVATGDGSDVGGGTHADNEKNAASPSDDVSKAKTTGTSLANASDSNSGDSASSNNSDADESTSTATKSPQDAYGLWVLAPALVAIIIAIFTRQVLIALPLGILTAAAMMLWLQGTADPISIFTYAVDKYLFEVLAPLDDGKVDFNKLKILIFTIFIGAMIGTVEASGGTRAMVARVTRHLSTRSRGQLGAWFAGLIVFIDDYANAMIVGPSMRPVFDRLKISREKLAYIVDSTAAPVASVFIGTWLVAEIGFIQGGINALGNDRPAFLADMTGNFAFWASLPYRTYAWLALVMVFLIALTGRDFGSMKTAEAKALNAAADANEQDENENDADREAVGRRWWLGVIPIGSMVIATIALLFITGYQGIDDQTREELSFSSGGKIVDSLGAILNAAAADDALLYAAIIGTLVALVLTLLSRACSLDHAMNGMMNGMQRMFAACVVLTLAWGLSQGSKDLQLSQVAADTLRTMEANGTFDSVLLPAVTFIAAAIVAFSTGTSWGTMGILCPAVVAIAARLYADIPEDQALPLFYATIGAVLTGAVFGDHCSPISDTTVMSSLASECDLGKHVWTQMPYALVVAVVGILSTDVLNYLLIRHYPDLHDQLGAWTVYAGTAVGAFMLLLIVIVIGRKPKVASPA